VRTVAADNTVRLGPHTLQILPDRTRPSYAQARVEVHERLAGGLAVYYQGRCLATQEAPPTPPPCGPARAELPALRPVFPPSPRPPPGATGRRIIGGAARSRARPGPGRTTVSRGHPPVLPRLWGLGARARSIAVPPRTSTAPRTRARPGASFARYDELAGERLPAAPPLPDVVVMVPQQPGDVDALLARMDRVITAMGLMTMVP
jgi:hypothetical protein